MSLRQRITFTTTRVVEPGACPLCDKSLIYTSEFTDEPPRGPAGLVAMTCGGFGRHRWWKSKTGKLTVRK